ncbi:MAG: helix-turn-helix transcriptional regulator [Bacteroidota bacterium]
MEKILYVNDTVAVTSERETTEGLSVLEIDKIYISSQLTVPTLPNDKSVVLFIDMNGSLRTESNGHTPNGTSKHNGHHQRSYFYIIFNQLDERNLREPVMIGTKNGSFGKLERSDSQDEATFTVLPFLNDPLSNQLALHIKREALALEDLDFLYLSCFAKSLMAHLTRLYQEMRDLEVNRLGGLTPGQIRSIDAYIYNALDTNITITKMAQIAELSTFHFSRMFKQTMGETPYQYVTKIKMLKAKELLIETGLPVIQIGLEVGFDNPGHFSRAFKKQFGYSPTQVRNFFSKRIA